MEIKKMYNIPTINQEEYDRLLRMEMPKQEEWDIHYHFYIHPLVQKMFKEEKHLDELFITSSDISKPEILNGSKGYEIPCEYLDHYHFITSNNIINNYSLDNVHGIFTFPYANQDYILKYKKDLGKYWDLFVINPILFRYSSTMGLFLYPKRENNDPIEIIISDINGYFQKRTGYPLFLYLSEDENTDIIEESYPKLNREEFAKFAIMDETDPKYKMWNKIVKFWRDNPDVYFENLDPQFKHYLDGLAPYLIINANLSIIKSAKKFKIYNEKIGDEFNNLNHFQTDLSFGCVYVDNKKIPIDEIQIKGFREGDYDICME